MPIFIQPKYFFVFRQYVSSHAVKNVSPVNSVMLLRVHNIQESVCPITLWSVKNEHIKCHMHGTFVSDFNFGSSCIMSISQVIYTQYYPVCQTEWLPNCLTLQYAKLNVRQLYHVYGISNCFSKFMLMI